MVYTWDTMGWFRMVHVVEFPTECALSTLILVASVTLQAYHNRLATEGNVHILKQRCIPAARSSAGLPASKSKRRHQGRFNAIYATPGLTTLLNDFADEPPVNSQAFYGVHSSCKTAWRIYVVCRRAYKMLQKQINAQPSPSETEMGQID